jgi:alpha-N-acetylglucosamine transferase
MENKKKVIPILIWIIIFLIIGGLLYWLVVSLAEEPIRLKDWISIFGSYASLYGLIVIIIQFQSVKVATSKTQEEISKISSITEWSKYAEMASNLKEDIRLDEFGLVVYKLHQIKQALQSMPVNALGKDQDIKKSQQAYIKAIHSHISSLDAVILDSSASVPKEKMMKDMEQVSDFFKIMVNKKIS